jgi:hypothetical protein
MATPTFTKRVSAGTRLYYFDICADKHGSEFLSITEVPTERNPGNKKRQKIFIHAEDIPAMLEAFAESASKILEHEGL